MNNKVQKFVVNRETALQAKPVKAQIVDKEIKDGKLILSVELERPLWQRVLGAEKKCIKKFALDTLGQEVYQMCDGKKTVSEILKIFAKEHKISLADAEIAVTTFMKTLISRGLIAIQIENGNTENKKLITNTVK